MKRQVVPVVMISIAAHREHVVTKHPPALHVNTTTMLQFAHLALSAKKYMHQSLVYHAKKFQLNA
jgi:hypothetical protein